MFKKNKKKKKKLRIMEKFATSVIIAMIASIIFGSTFHIATIYHLTMAIAFTLVIFLIRLVLAMSKKVEIKEVV